MKQKDHERDDRHFPQSRHLMWRDQNLIKDRAILFEKNPMAKDEKLLLSG